MTAMSMRRAARALEEALGQGHLIPVCFISARIGAGVDELVDVIVRLLPNSTEGETADSSAAKGMPSRHAPDPTQATRARACLQDHG